MIPDIPRAVPAMRGYTVFYEGKALLSTKDPAAACERLIAALPKDERTLYLCVSPLFGYGLERLLDTMHPASALLCVEPDAPLAGFARQHLPAYLMTHPRFALVTGPTDSSPAAALATVFARWGHRAFRRVVRFDLSPALRSARSHIARTIEDTLRREIALEWENAATLMKLGRRYALNFLHNLCLLGTTPSVETLRLVPEECESYKGGMPPPSLRSPPSATPLSGGQPPATPPFSIQGPVSSGGGPVPGEVGPVPGEVGPVPGEVGPVPGGGEPVPLVPVGDAAAHSHNATPKESLCGAVAPKESPRGAPDGVAVLGAGPSLDRFFAEYRGGTIVCVDTALPALRTHGLRADLVVALEAQHWNLRDFIGCRRAARALAMDMSALPATADCIDGPTYLFFTPWTPLRIFGRLRALGLLPLEMPPLGNVGITAYALARRLFPGTIVPYGLDFAFTIDQYHCRDSPGHIDLLRKLDRLHSPFPVEAALRPSTLAAVNETGEPVRQNPVMRRYRELFLATQRNGIPFGTAASARSPRVDAKTAAAFIRTLRSELTRIRNILSGQEKAGSAELAALLDQNDFLFAHYPDYAETRNPANIEDLSFLKRIRAEIDAFIHALPGV